ncbi:MAG: type IV pilus twitching motility protein PilT [Janthinobacterium lividum]
MDLNSLLTQMIEMKASDLHLVVGVPPVFRVNGDLTALRRPTDTSEEVNAHEKQVRHLLGEDQMPNLTAEDLDALLHSALPEDKLTAARDGRDFSATLRHDDQTFRCQVFRERGKLAAAIRILPCRIPTLEEMHLPPIFEKLTHLRRGLVLVVGPTGSGKTTTLVSMLEQINSTRSERIYTIEEPMNYVLTSKLSLITQRVVGEDVESYEHGLLSTMDADPDVVFIGELKTTETARLALRMAETGHLIFSQITAETAADAIAQLLGMLGEPCDLAQSLLARTLQAVIAQKLLPRDAQAGRVAANEILISTPQVRQMIMDGQIQPNLLVLAMEASSRFGMQTMDEALLKLHANGTISRETAESHLLNKSRLPST